MGVVMSKRPRRLVVVAAVIALAAALFVAIQAPLHAQGDQRITIKFDGKNYFVSPEQLQAAENRDPPFTQESSTGRTVTFGLNQKGATLDSLMDEVKVPSKAK